MRQALRAAAAFVLFAAAAFAFAAGDVVVLKGGARLELRKPPERQGGVVLLTRSDGTLLSVHAADIDWKATSAARNAGTSGKQEPAIAATPDTPAEAARSSREGPKARVKLTDADVGHVGEEESPPGEKKDAAARPGGARLDVIDYGQERSGSTLIVRGTIRNSGSAPAANAKMTVTAMDEKGETIASGEAGLSNGLVAPGGTVSFSVAIPVAEKFVGSIRFAPQWLASAVPGPARSPVPAAPTPAAGRAASPPASPPPARTPYGQGTLYAAPAPPASLTPPADGKTGYIPGMSSPENQPKPPD